MNVSDWLKGGYQVSPPRWLAASLMGLSALSMVSDMSFMMRQGGSGGTVMISLGQTVFVYLGLGFTLTSIRASFVLTGAAMFWTLVIHYSPLPLVAAAAIALVSCAIGTRQTIWISITLSAVWIAAVLAVGGALTSQPINRMGFFWLTVDVLFVATLVGSGIRFLVVRAAKIKAQLRDIEAAAEEARVAERRALARELHDVVAHHITVITMQAMAGRNSGDAGALRNTMEVIEESSRQALTELRALLGVLRAEERDHPPLGAASSASGTDLAAQVDVHVGQLKEHGIKVSKVTLSAQMKCVPLSIQATCGRILRESVTNILKYSLPGASCAIVLDVDRDGVNIRIVNDKLKDLERRHPSLSSGFGLTSLNERVRALGGAYRASRSGDEWVVSARIPIPSSD